MEQPYSPQIAIHITLIIIMGHPCIIRRLVLSIEASIVQSRQCMFLRQEHKFMAITADGFQQTIITEQLSLIPLPRFWTTDKAWQEAIVSELRPYFIIPRVDYSTFVDWIFATLDIRELAAGDSMHSDLIHTISVFRKGAADHFWILERKDKNKLFFNYHPPLGNQSEVEEDGWTVIGYHPELDVFYSNSNFLENVLGYFRGIDPDDLVRDSRELYPIRTALSYANNLDGVLRQFSAWRGIELIRQILTAKKLIISNQDGRRVILSEQSFLPIIQTIFSSEYYSSTQFPQSDADRKYRLDFWKSDGSVITLFYGEKRLYYGKQEYYELEDARFELTKWLHTIIN